MNNNQHVNLAGKEEVKKITLRVPTDAAEKFNLLANKMDLPQGSAFEKVIKEYTLAKRKLKRYRRKFKALVQAGFTNPSTIMNANFVHNPFRIAPNLDQSLAVNSDETVANLNELTASLRRATVDQKSAQNALLSELKGSNVAAIKAAQSFSKISDDATKTISSLQKIEDLLNSNFSTQHAQIERYVESIGRGLQAKIEDERRDHIALDKEKEKSVQDLLKRADEIAQAYANSFTEGVGQIVPQVEKIRTKIDSEMNKVRIFNRLSYGMGGLVFLVGLALFYFYKPLSEKWDEHTQVTAAVSAVTSEYGKKIAAAEAHSKELEHTISMMKQDQDEFKKRAVTEAEINVRNAMEKTRIKVFESEAQKFKKEVTDLNYHIGELQSRNVILRRKLAKNCNFFCTGDYNDSNGEPQ